LAWPCKSSPERSHARAVERQKITTILAGINSFEKESLPCG
jgi:hypothetical protein